ncbi:hypothetical protein OJ997_24235 [Solirubrobacter phytolaccae]|uniref:Integral membrane protein n=1 Tax=Solirubrobacter phytolaccae TaxID=1404360 RepID=A0A9X3SD99_9ACTN|nr:hypothetical protein [Solirubrobacter phytolaccae]MDA0183440.1 hypothetical protein [Solirubrobacter phytolaccae]
MTDVAINDEVERLRARNAELERRVARRVRWRSTVSGLLLVLGCGLAVLSLVAIWLRVTLLDTDRYVSTVAPIAAQPAVQDAVAKQLETAIYSRVDFTSLARQVLPDRADVLAPAIETGAKTVISQRIASFTRSEQFQTLWVEANRRAHTRLVALLTTGRSNRLVLDDETLYLDLSPVVDRVKTALSERGLSRIAAAIPPTVDGQVELVQSSAFADARAGVRWLKAMAVFLPALALLCLAGSVYFASRWRRGLLRAGIGVALAMLGLIAVLAVARSLYLDALGQGALPRDAASGIFDTLVALLRDGVRVVVVVALLVALVTYLAGMPLGRYARRVWGSSQRRWVARYQRTLMLITGGLGLLVLFAWSPLTGGVVLVTLLAVGVVCGLIAALGLEARDPVTDQLRADDQEQDGHDHRVVGGHP